MIRRVRFVFLFFLTMFFNHSIHAQVIADFEDSNNLPVLTPAGATVINNPDTNGNSSNKVAYYPKPSGNWYAIYFNFVNKININSNDQLVFKIRSSTKGRVYVKIVNDGTVVLENWAPDYSFQPEANTWTQASLDISTLANTQFDRIEVNASVDNTATADVYLDDFKLMNSASPNGEPIVSLSLSASKVKTGETIHFDASASADYDGSVTSYQFDFGDGSSASGATVDHSYGEDGIYEARIVIADNDGNKSEKKFTIVVMPITGKLSQLSFVSDNLVVNEKIEAIFAASDYENVYDPDEVSIDATITLPDNTTIVVPCFYFEKSHYQATGDNWINDGDAGYWMVRFTSPQSGLHKIQLTLTDSDGMVSSNIKEFSLAGSSARGIIHHDENNLQYYRHATGEPFFPMGINVAWGATTMYSTIINNLGAGKANLVRYWQVPFDRQGLEWKAGSGFYKGIGRFSQEAAAEQDSVMELCNANNIYLQITLFQHGMYSETVNSNWSDNPYNSINGGPLTKAEQFFYNADVKTSTKKLLRYIIARWGYSCNLFAWELFNEVNFTGNFPNQTSQWYPGVLQWHNEMGQYIKSLDAFDHIVTSSTDETQLSDFNALTGLNVVQYHLYNTNLLDTQISKDKSIRSGLTRTGLINGEYGKDVNTADVPFKEQRIAIWSSIMTQVPHFMWNWNNYTSAAWSNLFKFPSAYLLNEDIGAGGELTNWSCDVTLNSESLRFTGLKNASHAWALISDQKLRGTISNVSLKVTDLTPGIYKITYTKIVTGDTTSVQKSITGTTTITVPSFEDGLALKFEFLRDGGITETEKDLSAGIEVFPNPSKGFINLKVYSEKLALELFDLNGRKIILRNFSINEDRLISINLKEYNLHAGIYLLKIKTDHDEVTRRIVYQPE